MLSKYDVQHKGSVIICGSAPCVFEDLEKAKRLRPDAEIVGVNNAGAMIPEIKHVWTQHNKLSKEYKENADVKVHGRSNILGDRHTDYIWPKLNWVCGSSGVGGALWARWGLGFDEVIMAGIPLNSKNTLYSEKYPSKYTKKHGFADKHQILNWLNHLMLHQKNEKTIGIYSMSGETMRILGEPSAI